MRDRAQKKLQMTSKSFSSRASGSWKPYIPQIGTPYGCRTESRSAQEKFYITHSASRIASASSETNRAYIETPGMRSSLTGSAVPKEDVNNQQRPMRKLFDTQTRSNLTSEADEKLYASRPHQGRVHEESRAEDSQVRRLMSSATCSPPDNLSLGLAPLVDWDIDANQRNRCVGYRNASSLGPGFQPIPEEVRDECAVSKEEELPTVYVRHYGIIKS